jgi:hypothetical protein
MLGRADVLERVLALLSQFKLTELVRYMRQPLGEGAGCAPTAIVDQSRYEELAGLAWFWVILATKPSKLKFDWMFGRHFGRAPLLPVYPQ